MSSEEEQKRRAVGICCYNLLGLVSTAAFVCAIYSYAYCDFATRYVQLTEGTDVDTLCNDLGFTDTGGLQRLVARTRRGIRRILGHRARRSESMLQLHATHASVSRCTGG